MARPALGHILVGSRSERRNGKNQSHVRIDYGSVALLFQDNVGGLEVENPRTKRFQPAKPIVCVVLYARQ